MNAVRSSLAIYAKDLRVEARTKETVISVFVFALLVAFVFNFAFDPTPQIVGVVGPGIVWIAYTFTGILGLNRTFVLERERGTLDGLLLAPVSREAIFVGKLLGVVTIMLVVEALLIPVFFVLYDLNLFDLWFVAIALLATIGFSSIGTLFSALAAHTRAREVLLPLLFLPIALPVIMAGVDATASRLQGGGWNEFGHWIPLLAAFDALFLVVSSLVFEFVLEE